MSINLYVYFLRLLKAKPGRRKSTGYEEHYDTAWEGNINNCSEEDPTLIINVFLDCQTLKSTALRHIETSASPYHLTWLNI
jgi:hypothetical protein